MPGYTGPGVPVMFNRPDGLGLPFDGAIVLNLPVEATISLYLIDESGVPVSLDFNSADLSGDLRVDLTDLGLFVVDFYGNYDFRSDLHFDEVINLSDLGRFADAFGAACP